MKETVEKKDLLRYILFRLLIITCILIAALIIQYSTGNPFPPVFLYAIAGFYGLSLIYYLLYLWGKWLTGQAYLQLIYGPFAHHLYGLYLGRCYHFDLFSLYFCHYCCQPGHFG